MSDKSAHVLVVDDEVIILNQLEEILEENGYTVVGKATNGADAIQTATKMKPDIVLMDIVMPGEIDGIEACNTIQSITECPVVLVTAYGDDQTLRKAKNVKPYGYVVKPYQNEQIRAAIEIALAKKELEEEFKNAVKYQRYTSEKWHLQLKEVHHRIKNHLAIIDSLISLKASSDMETGCRETITNIKDSIQAVALIHEKLYKAEDTKTIECKEYISGVLAPFNESVLKAKNIRLVEYLEELRCDAGRVMILGLVLCELLANAVKYAFGDEKGGEIEVSFFKEDGVRVLQVRDNGTGMIRESESESGLVIAEALVEQLGGSLSIESGNGTTVSVSFEAA
jgi:two-component sensor histidine kinase